MTEKVHIEAAKEIMPPRAWSMGPRSSWVFIPGETICEVHGCARLARYLFGRIARFRVALCGDSHAALEGADGLVRGPQMSPQPTARAGVHDHVDQFWDDQTNYWCCIESCPGIGAIGKGHHFFCLFHEEVFDGQCRALVDESFLVIAPEIGSSDWTESDDLGLENETC